MKKYLTCLLVLIMLLFTGCIKSYKTVTFDSDGGTPVESIKVEKGNTINEPSAPTKEKYEFVGWFLDGEKFNFKNTKIEKNITLKAGWLKNEVTYEVVFKDYDGTELKKETVKEGNSATAPVPPTREGYTFTGWDKDFTNVQSNLVITAQYEKKEYPLYINGYNTQGATSLGENQGLFLFKKGTTIGSSLYWYKVAIKINNGKYIVSSVAKSGESTPTDYDYILLSYESDTTGAYSTLVGFNLKENDIVTFSKDITTLNNGAVNVGVKFAKVEIKTYNLTLNANGGEVTYNNTFTNDEEVILPIPTKANCNFGGWYLTNDFSGEKYTKIEKGTAQDLTFYAKWEELLISLGSLNINGYNTQGATSLGANQGLFLFKKGTTIGSSLYWYKVAIKINNGKYIVSSVAKSGESTPTDYDYLLLSYESDTTGAYTTLVGLNLKENDIVTFSKDITTLSNGAVEVTVEFLRKTTEDVVTSTLTLELNGGVTDFAKATFTNFEEVILPIPTKANCIFGGWYLTNDFSGEKYTKIEKGTKQDMKFYAKWEEESYENLLKYVSDVVTSYTNDTLPTTFNGLTLEWSSSNNNLYQIVNGIGSTNRVYQTHKKQSVTITLKVDNQIFTKTIIINPVLFDDMTNPKAVYFAIGSASNYKNNSQRYKDEGTLFSDKFKNNMDMVYYAFAIPQTSGQVTLNTQYISELMKLKKNGIRVLMVIDGANRAPLQAMVKLCNNDETRKTFVSNIVSLITKYNFDGVDIDWEFPGVSGLDGYTTAIDQVNLNKLLRDLRNSLDSYQDEGGSKYIISAAIPSTSWGAARYKFKGDSTLGGINDYCDYVNMMSYDLNKSDYTSHVAACYSSKNANDYKFGAVYGADKFISLGLDKNKIILGTAAYGKAYSVTGTSTSTTYPGLGVSAKLTQITGVSGSFTSGTIYYTGIANLMTNPNYKLYTEMNNGKVVGSYLYNNIDKIFITFDSSLAVKSKCEYAKANGMGIMVWAYGEDATDTIVDTICDNLK